MKTSLISFYAACSITAMAGVKAVKSSQDEWWMTSSNETDTSSTSTQETTPLDPWWLSPDDTSNPDT